MQVLAAVQVECFVNKGQSGFTRIPSCNPALQYVGEVRLGRSSGQIVDSMQRVVDGDDANAGGQQL